MSQDLERASRMLEVDYTCVVCRDDAVYTATERGVKPLLDLLEQGDVLHSAQADDRVWRTGESPDAWDPLNPFGAPADDRHRIRRWAR